MSTESARSSGGPFRFPSKIPTRLWRHKTENSEYYFFSLFSFFFSFYHPSSGSVCHVHLRINLKSHFTEKLQRTTQSVIRLLSPRRKSVSIVVGRATGNTAEAVMRTHEIPAEIKRKALYAPKQQLFNFPRLSSIPTHSAQGRRTIANEYAPGGAAAVKMMMIELLRKSNHQK